VAEGSDRNRYSRRRCDADERVVKPTMLAAGL
jgi:hypothetical protein